MSKTFLVEVSEDAARTIEQAAHSRGMTPADYVAEAALQRAGDLAEVAAFFANRARGADVEAFNRIMQREGGEPPAPGDEITP
jgi:uncharacterized protein (DUF1778 family)